MEYWKCPHCGHDESWFDRSVDMYKDKDGWHESGPYTRCNKCGKADDDPVAETNEKNTKPLVDSESFLATANLIDRLKWASERDAVHAFDWGHDGIDVGGDIAELLKRHAALLDAVQRYLWTLDHLSTVAIDGKKYPAWEEYKRARQDLRELVK